MGHLTPFSLLLPLPLFLCSFLLLSPLYIFKYFSFSSSLFFHSALFIRNLLFVIFYQQSSLVTSRLRDRIRKREYFSADCLHSQQPHRSCKKKKFIMVPQSPTAGMILALQVTDVVCTLCAEQTSIRHCNTRITAATPCCL